MKRQYVVRIVWHKTDNLTFNNPFIECLRYAGIAVVHNEHCFDLPAPHGVGNTKEWAMANAARISSFGYNAVVAPSWEVPT